MSNFLADVDTYGIMRALDLADLRAAVESQRFCRRSGVPLTTPTAVLVVMTHGRSRARVVLAAEVFDVLRPSVELTARYARADLKIIDGREF